MKLAKGEHIELEIIDTAEKDQWFGRSKDNIGVFVRGKAAVGDVIEAEIVSTRKSFATAHVVEIRRPSTNRCAPVCAHFGVCGGCKWQHLTYNEQLRLKHAAVVAALTRIAGIEQADVRPIIPADRTTNYRNKVEFSFSDTRFLTDDEIASGKTEFEKPTNFALGFHAPRNFYKVVDVDRCHIAAPDMNTVLNTVRSFAQERQLIPYSIRGHHGYLRHLMVRQANHTQDLMVNLVTATYEKDVVDDLAKTLVQQLKGGLTTLVNNITAKKADVSTGESEIVVHGPGQITEVLGGCRFRISANSFFQTNSYQAERLIEVVRNIVCAEPTDIIYDLYCGTGSLSLPLATNCTRLLGIDHVPAAISDACGNAALNGITNCDFRACDLNRATDLLEEFHAFGIPQLVVTDPPRAGMNPRTVSILARLRPGRIVYVSCNPASLARDAAALCGHGGYELVYAQPIDMFPFTNHIETVALLKRREL